MCWWVHRAGRLLGSGEPMRRPAWLSPSRPRMPLLVRIFASALPSWRPFTELALREARGRVTVPTVFTDRWVTWGLLAWQRLHKGLARQLARADGRGDDVRGQHHRAGDGAERVRGIEPALSAWGMCGAAGLPPAGFVTCGNLDGLCLSDGDYPRVLLPSGTAGTAGVILIVGVMPAGPRLATDVAISPSRKWIFIGS